MTTTHTLAATLLVTLPFTAHATAGLPPLPNGDSPGKRITFWENLGQEYLSNGDPADDVKFVSEGTQPKCFFQKNSTVSMAYAFSLSGQPNPDVAARIDLHVVGETALNSSPEGTLVRGQRRHYWLDQHAPNAILNVAGFAGVTYEDIYPGIDWHWFSGIGGRKMAFVCRPNSSPEDIRIQFTGQDSLRLDWEGALKAYLYDGELKLKRPMAYQYDQQGNISMLSWTASYTVNNGSATMSMEYDSYDPTLPLVFLVEEDLPPAPPPPDNNIPYSTYVGGAFNETVNEIAVASNGDYYVVGKQPDMSLPNQVGLVGIDYQAYQRGFIAKFDHDYVPVWTGYYAEDVRTVALDEVNRRLVVGGDPQNGVQFFGDQLGSGYYSGVGDACLAAWDISDPLVPELVWSTRWKAYSVTKVVTTATGRIYVVGQGQPGTETVSPGSDPGKFYQFIDNGNGDGYISCFDLGTHILFSTRYGGEGGDVILDMAIDEPVGRFAVVGFTTSIGNQGAYNCSVTPGAFPECSDGGDYSETWCNGSNTDCSGPYDEGDGFIGLFSLDMDWVWSTRFGGQRSQALTGVDFDAQHNLYVVGAMTSPEEGIDYCAVECQPPSPANTGMLAHCSPNDEWTQLPGEAGYGDHILAKFDVGDNLRWSTTIGGSGPETFIGFPFNVQSDAVVPAHAPQIAIDEAGDIYVAGTTCSGCSNFIGTVPLPMNEDPQYYYQQQNIGGSELPDWSFQRPDVYVGKFHGSDGSPVMGSFYGGRGGRPGSVTYSNNGDMLTCLAVRGSRVFIGGATASNSLFPISALDGVSDSYQIDVPPVNLIEGTTDEINGFVAQLSWLYTALPEMELPSTAHGIQASYNQEDNTATISLPTPWHSEQTTIDLFDAAGRTLSSTRAFPIGGKLTIPLPAMSSGLYVGRLLGTSYSFKLAKPR